MQELEFDGDGVVIFGKLCLQTDVGFSHGKVNDVALTDGGLTYFGLVCI